MVFIYPIPPHPNDRTKQSTRQRNYNNEDWTYWRLYPVNKGRHWIFWMMFWRLPKNKWVGERNKTIKDFTSYQRPMTDILDFKTSPKEYRVWYNGKMYYDGLRLGSYDDLSIDQLNSIFTMQDTVLLQRTGLYDKNNKKIREGDIVSITPFRHKRYNIWVVEFWPYHHLNEAGHRGVECLWFYIARDWEPIFCDNWRGDEIEVIGNVFENSDLLQ